MGFMVSVSKQKKYTLFLNFSFLLVTSVFLITHFNSAEISVIFKKSSKLSNEIRVCNEFPSEGDHETKCNYLKTHDPCVSQGYINYLHLFYCKFGSVQIWGYFGLFLWLLVLFYLLGNTASEYFCSSLENLSGLLKLSPIIAGVTLLSLGNGAPDVFASLVSFMGNETSDVGFNTVLGGASFITSVVVGIMSILVREKEISVNRFAFLRDVCFFLIVLSTLSFILFQGQISLLGAIGFLGMYIIYVIIVYFSDMVWSSSKNNCGLKVSENFDLSIPILSRLEKGEEVDNYGELELKKQPFWGIMVNILEMPLYLPRRLTIPVVSEEKWSKPVAVISVTLAPILLSFLWNSQEGNFVIYGIGLLIGVTLGFLANSTTEKSNPPRKFLFPWLAGGFIMSVIWSYLIAQELVGLLVSIGFIFQISPSILGLTVLAWGNSLGDLITNLTMALNHNGHEGAQVAMSGCYAGPIFNILFGLGLSLVSSAWLQYPSPVMITKDPYLLETLMFLVASLVWALVILPSRKMRLDGVLGGGLLVIYFVSVSIRLIQTLGSLQFQDT
ncbi:cation/calcium exchanger 2 [Mercurialis annua]|uniref:cation/calcium exchanger 2 n=1 Tax=Mercurialis annua TaxID=3986 RepID=UPI00215F0407|nr:cation/calcium exchanger 2 [Mercurialis annua]